MCSGGVSQPEAKPGFSPGNDGTFIPCSPETACVGDGECAEGYEGDRCAACSVGFHRVAGYCRPCGPATLLAALLGCVALVAFCVCLVLFNLRNSGRASRLSSLVIGLNALQVVAQFGRLALAWPPYVQTLFDILSLFNFSIEFVAPECAISSGNPFVLRYIATMLLPAVTLLVLGVGYGCFAGAARVLQLAGDRVHEVTRAFFQAASQLVLILYLPLSVAAFEYFDCVDAGVSE